MPLHLTRSFSGNPRMINGFSQGDIQAENCCLFFLLLLFLRVLPEHTAEPQSTRAGKKSGSAASASITCVCVHACVHVCECVCVSGSEC